MTEEQINRVISIIKQVFKNKSISISIDNELAVAGAASLN
jgi:hypothetical protein